MQASPVFDMTEYTEVFPPQSLQRKDEVEEVLMVEIQLAGEQTVVSTVTSQRWKLRFKKLKRSRGRKREDYQLQIIKKLFEI